MRKLANAVVWMMLLALAGGAWADDRHPAPYRGAPNSLLAKWENLPAPPDLVFDEGLSADTFDTSAAVDPVFPAPALAAPGFPPGTICPPGPCLAYGETGFGPGYSIFMPNVVDELPLKHLRLQLTWLSYGEAGGAAMPPPDPLVRDAYDSSVLSPYGPSSVFYSPLELDAPDGITGDVTGYQYIDYVWEPNPDFEVFFIPFFAGQRPGDTAFPPEAWGDGYLTQVVIDSVSSVPVPAALPLFGSALGGLSLLGWRRRRSKA